MSTELGRPQSPSLIMARTGKTAQEFIQDSFSPIISILSSSKVDPSVSKNNLSLIELLHPFSNLNWEGQFREPGGSICIVKNWKLTLRDINWKPLQPTEARRQLNNAVLHNYNDKVVSLELEGRKIDVPQSTPWFDAWRETYLEVQFPSDHEFTKHFLSCVIVATTNDENIIDTFNSLNQQYAQLQNVTPPKLPKWFNNGVLKSYLLLHDVSTTSKDKADATFEILKQTFGAGNCFMMTINSKTSVDQNLPTDFWAQYIKRSSETSIEMSSSFTNLPTTPQGPQVTFVPQNLTQADDSNNGLISSTHHEGIHPLTNPENDFYDNANSLQTHSFSGSSESMSVAGKLTDSTEVHGAALNANDIDSIKNFLQEYASKALLPYLEKQISQISELVANRKGVSRSLFSATKRWFGTGKGGNTTTNNTVIYSSDCPELQLRRLGDLWFLCGQWQRAFDAYHTAKREFYADSAWLCYAGALEMAAISAFMAGEANRKTHAYMEESIVTYLNTCRMAQYAVRATLLSVICLTASGLHGEAAKQLIRMTSEDSDLRSAMLLEQAALSFLSGPGSKAMRRKYAFHMVLAGHRFSKAGQKKHAYRCYKQAFQVYGDHGWRLATDHVQFALGRLAGALKLSGAARSWLAAPLRPLGSQPPAQQDAFLREYMQAHQQWVESGEEEKGRISELAVPLTRSRATAVLCVGAAPLSAPGRVPATSLTLPQSTHEIPHTQDKSEARCWHKLEEMLLQVAQGTLPMIFKPTIDLYIDATDMHPAVPQGEPIHISVTLVNPLKIWLILKDVELLWRFISSGDEIGTEGEILNNEPAVAAGGVLENNVISGQKIKSVAMEGECEKMLIFTVTPLRVGRLQIQGLAYKLFNGGENGTENGTGLLISGKVNLTSSEHGNIKRLEIEVYPHAPCLQMTFSETSADAMSGEMRSIDIELRNGGPVEMRNVHIAVSHPECMRLLTNDADSNDLGLLYAEKFEKPPNYADERAARTGAWRRQASRHARCVARCLAAGATARFALLLRPTARAHTLRLLAYYEPPPHTTPLRYRLVRHIIRFNVSEVVELSVNPRRSLKKDENEVSENMNLGVEVKNASNDKEDVVIEVLEASLLSRQWKLTDLISARDMGDRLLPRERLHMILKAKRYVEESTEGSVLWSYLKIANGHPDSVDHITKPPYSKFLSDYKSSFDETEVAVPQNKKGKIGLIQSMFVVRWKAHNKTKGISAVGQHCIWLECFKKTEYREKDYHKTLSTDSTALQLDDCESKIDIYENKSKKNKDNVVLFCMEHPAQVKHNFGERKLCSIPIVMNIVNCHGYPIEVFVDMSKRQISEPFSQVGWTGALAKTGDGEARESGAGVRVSLRQWESTRMCVQAVCATPGAYLMGAALSLAQSEHLAAQAHYADDTSLLLVTQSA